MEQVLAWKSVDGARVDHPSGVVELDDPALAEVNGGTTPYCAATTVIIATITTCFGNTAIWGSCELGTRGCCR